MTEFTSKIEELHKAKELDFDSTPGFGTYKRFFPKEAVAHPAKMNTHLLEYLIETFTKEGDAVLDCMGGSGSTAVLASLHNRHAIVVELEEKFVSWIEQAKEKVLGAPTVLPKGEIKVVKGDARNLSQLLGSADAAIMSPPYSDGISRNSGSRAGHQQIKIQVGISTITSDEYSKDPNNVGNLKHGEVDAIVTSPPYNTRSDGEGLNKTGIPNGRGGFKDKADTLKYSDTPENIGNIVTHGEVDGIITSPPYAQSSSRQDDREEFFERLAKDPTSNRFGRVSHPTTGAAYSQDKANIGNLKVDEIITSPPYENSEAFQDTDFAKKMAADMTPRYRTAKLKPDVHTVRGHARSTEAEQAYMERAEKGRIENPDSIGKLSSSSKEYEVYMRCHELLQRLTNVSSAVIHAISGQNDVPTATSEKPPTVLESPLVKTTEEILACIMQARSLDIEIGTRVVAFLSLLGLAIRDGRVENNTGEALDGMQLRRYLMSSLDYVASSADSSLQIPQREDGSSEHTISSPSRKEERTISQIWSEYAQNAIEELRTSLMQEGSRNIKNSAESRGLPKQRESYLQAMSQVYSEMFKTLRAGGRAVIVIKPFTRERKVVDLPYQTWILLQRCGFVLDDVLKLRLKHMSFWRVLQYKKFPDQEQIRHEYVVVVRKP